MEFLSTIKRGSVVGDQLSANVIHVDVTRYYGTPPDTTVLLFRVGSRKQTVWPEADRFSSRRLSAVRFASNILVTAGQWRKASLLLVDAVKPLPYISPQSLPRTAQEYSLSSFPQRCKQVQLHPIVVAA